MYKRQEYFIDADKRIARQKEIINSLPSDAMVNLICPLSGYDYFTEAFNMNELPEMVRSLEAVRSGSQDKKPVEVTFGELVTGK